MPQMSVAGPFVGSEPTSDQICRSWICRHCRPSVCGACKWNEEHVVSSKILHRSVVLSDCAKHLTGIISMESSQPALLGMYSIIIPMLPLGGWEEVACLRPPNGDRGKLQTKYSMIWSSVPWPYFSSAVQSCLHDQKYGRPACQFQTSSLVYTELWSTVHALNVSLIRDYLSVNNGHAGER